MPRDRGDTEPARAPLAAVPDDPEPPAGDYCAHGLPVNSAFCPGCDAVGAGPTDAAEGAPRVRTNKLRARLINRAQLAALPRPDPLISDTFDQRALVMLAGAWGTCKTFIALDWACCAATGKPWQGRDVTPGRVLYIAAEGAYGLSQRVAAWEQGWRTRVPADQLMVIPAPAPLGTAAGATDLAELAAELDPDLIVVDTLARCAVGLDENAARDMGLLVDALDRTKAATTRGTVLVVHHTGKDRTTVRGSSVLESSCDTVYCTAGGPDCLTLTRTKRKDGPLPDALVLGLDPVSGTDSAVLSRVRGPADKINSSRALMSAFVSAFAVSGATKAELRNVAGLAPASFHRALNSCLEQGRLVNTGSDSRPFYRLGNPDA